MITQYSQKQLTLSEKEKEYAWFHYAAKIIQSGCIDQQMSGYKVTGTGIDGNQVEAELTNEELFQLFSEVTMLNKTFSGCLMIIIFCDHLAEISVHFILITGYIT